MAELKPCPFCGSTNISCADAGHKTDIWFVQCENCGATFPHFDSETEAAEAWNGRVDNKQIPKKPQYVDTRFRHHGRKISDGSSLDKCYKCPNCNSHIFHVFDSEKYCKYCGQALDWSDNNG